jgi:hypothetical protein
VRKCARIYIETYGKVQGYQVMVAVVVAGIVPDVAGKVDHREASDLEGMDLAVNALAFRSVR